MSTYPHYWRELAATIIVDQRTSFWRRLWDGRRIVPVKFVASCMVKGGPARLVLIDRGLDRRPGYQVEARTALYNAGWEYIGGGSFASRLGLAGRHPRRQGDKVTRPSS